MIEEHAPIAELSERLRHVVECAAHGHADKEIAARLGLSVHTVDTHWRRLKDIFGAANRAETIAKYLASRHDGDRQEAEERRAELEGEIERLRAEVKRLEVSLREREAASVRMVEDAVRAGWQDAHDRERLVRLDRAVELGGTMYYEGEIGGLWRKRWATENIAEYGYTAQDFVEGVVRVADLVPAEDLMNGHIKFEKALEDGEASLTTCYRLRRADGAVRWVRDRMTFVRDESGRAVGYYGAVTDVTDIVQSERSQFPLASVGMDHAEERLGHQPG